LNPGPLALSLGDPAGIGPEIIDSAWRRSHAAGPAFVVIGDAAALASADPEIPIRRVASPAEAAACFSQALPVIDQPLDHPATPGVPSAEAAPFVVGWIETAVALALAGEAGGVVTAPIAKSTLYEAGFKFPGHTEFIGQLTAEAPVEGERGPVMLLTAGGLRVSLVTIHEPLARVPALITSDRIVRAGRITAQALARDFGVPRPRIVVAGLNPHAGEGGTIGGEEIAEVAPAVLRLRDLGIDTRGPLPADSLFHADARSSYDAALCLYHDQALIPVKMLDFWGGVNVTLGLPVVRASPDHGTAFDIAGQGLARPDSLLAAIRLAAEIAARRGAARGVP
jgi:4-hydroxythreonine-4-phosphate dehydrogenase